MAITCGVCGSEDVTSQAEGLNVTKGIVGDLLVGPKFGLFLAGRNKNRIILTCLACGDTWRPGEQIKPVRRAVTEIRFTPTQQEILSPPENPQAPSVNSQPPRSFRVVENDEPNLLRTLLFWIGVLVAPYIFGWFTLREKHGGFARFVAFGWMLLIGGIIIVGNLLPSAPNQSVQQTVQPKAPASTPQSAAISSGSALSSPPGTVPGGAPNGMRQEGTTNGTSSAMPQVGSEASNQFNGITDNVALVTQYYHAIERATWTEASSYVIPEKRDQGPLSASALSQAYRALQTPLHLGAVEQSPDGSVIAHYMYVSPNGDRCVGTSRVMIVNKPEGHLIDDVIANENCS
jgi:hypothetical protein